MKHHSIRGLNKAEVLLALYNNAKTSWHTQLIETTLFFLNSSLNEAEAQELLERNPKINCIGSVGIYIDFSGDTIDIETYDNRYYEQGTARSAADVIMEYSFMTTGYCLS